MNLTPELTPASQFITRRQAPTAADRRTSAQHFGDIRKYVFNSNIVPKEFFTVEGKLMAGVEDGDLRDHILDVNANLMNVDRRFLEIVAQPAVEWYVRKKFTYVSGMNQTPPPTAAIILLSQTFLHPFLRQFQNVMNRLNAPLKADDGVNATVKQQLLAKMKPYFKNGNQDIDDLHFHSLVFAIIFIEFFIVGNSNSKVNVDVPLPLQYVSIDKAKLTQELIEDLGHAVTESDKMMVLNDATTVKILQPNDPTVITVEAFADVFSSWILYPYIDIKSLDDQTDAVSGLWDDIRNEFGQAEGQAVADKIVRLLTNPQRALTYFNRFFCTAPSQRGPFENVCLIDASEGFVATENNVSPFFGATQAHKQRRKTIKTVITTVCEHLARVQNNESSSISKSNTTLAKIASEQAAKGVQEVTQKVDESQVRIDAALVQHDNRIRDLAAQIANFDGRINQAIVQSGAGQAATQIANAAQNAAGGANTLAADARSIAFTTQARLVDLSKDFYALKNEFEALKKNLVTLADLAALSKRLGALEEANRRPRDNIQGPGL